MCVFFFYGRLRPQRIRSNLCLQHRHCWLFALCQFFNYASPGEQQLQFTWQNMSALFPFCPCECWASVTWLQCSILLKQKLIYKSDTTIHLWHGQNRCIRLMQKPLVSERPSQTQIGVCFNYSTCEVRFVLLSLWIAEEAELIGVYWMVEPVTGWPLLKVGGSTGYNSF